MEGDVKTYRGRTLEEILPRVREELGPEAVVLRRREGLAGGIGGFFQRRFVEIEARGPEAAHADAAGFGDAAGPGEPGEPAVRNDRASAEGLASPAVRALVAQAQPFADALARAESGVSARADAVLAAAAQGAAGAAAGRSPADLAPDLLGALRAAPPAGPSLGRDEDVVAADPGLYGPQPRRFAPARETAPAASEPRRAEPEGPQFEPSAPRGPQLARSEPRGPEPGSSAQDEAAGPPADGSAPAASAVESPLDPPAPAADGSLVERTGTLAEHLLAAIAASRGLAEEEAGSARPSEAEEDPEAPEDPPAARHSAGYEGSDEAPAQETEASAAEAEADEPPAAEPEPPAAEAEPVQPSPPAPPSPGPAPQAPPLAPAPPSSSPGVRHAVPDRLTPAGSEELEARLEAAGLSRAFATEVVAEAVAHGMPFAAPGQLAGVVRLALTRRIPVMGPVGTGARVLAVVGAGGAGKSALTAHLAAAYADAGARVVLVALRSSDGGRAQAARLEALGVTVLAARDAADARERMAGPAPLITLLDTPSVSLADPAGLPALAADLRGLGSAEVHLALPATVSTAAAQESLEAFAGLGPTHLALTHADETRRPGAPVELAIRTGRPLSYLCTRDAVAPVDAAALAERLLP